MTFNRGHSAAAKLTPQQVLEIRDRYNSGWTQGKLSREYQVSIGQIGRIVRGEAWQQYRQEAHPDAIEHSLAKLKMTGVEIKPLSRPEAGGAPGGAGSASTANDLAALDQELFGDLSIYDSVNKEEPRVDAMAEFFRMRRPAASETEVDPTSQKDLKDENPKD